MAFFGVCEPALPGETFPKNLDHGRRFTESERRETNCSSHWLAVREGIFDESIAMLKALNAQGYGRYGSGLELDLVSNPTGAFMPPSQEQIEKRYHQILEQKWGLTFNRLFSFANVPLGRFKQWLIRTGNYEPYLQKLVASFNPCAIEGLMCRNQVSIAWDGYLYDCDFNLARGLYMCGNKIHVSEISGPPEPGTPIITADHCYTCAAGSGFT